MRGKKIIGSYSGIRPATEFSDYQIFFDENKNFITVGGIRSTGLSASRIGLTLIQNLSVVKLRRHTLLFFSLIRIKNVEVFRFLTCCRSSVAIGSFNGLPSVDLNEPST